MKQRILRLVLPLTILSFAAFTRWWYAGVVDAPDTMFWGFPLPFMCPGWHTSMSLQIFVLELLADLAVYFLFWLAVVEGIWRLRGQGVPSRRVVVPLWALAGLALAGMLFIGVDRNHLYSLTRPFPIEVKATGAKFIWQQTVYPTEAEIKPAL